MSCIVGVGGGLPARLTYATTAYWCGGRTHVCAGSGNLFAIWVDDVYCAGEGGVVGELGIRETWD